MLLETPQSLPEHITAMPGRFQCVIFFSLCLGVLWEILALCTHHFLKFFFCISVQTRAKAPARETEWDQCSADHGSVPFCQLCAH